MTAPLKAGTMWIFADGDLWYVEATKDLHTASGARIPMFRLLNAGGEVLGVLSESEVRWMLRSRSVVEEAEPYDVP